MRICVDVDGTICETRRPEQSYSDVEPLEGAIESLKALKASGHYIILNTSRHMRTCDGNVGMVVARQGKTLLTWLDDHEVPYDEVWFGKPYAEIYIDDNVIPFKSWDATMSKVNARIADSNP